MHNMKQRYFLCLAACMTIAQLAYSQQEVKKLTLKEAVDIALKNNPQIAEARLRSESSAIILNQSKRDLLPTVQFDVNHGLNQGRSIDPFTNSYIDQDHRFASYSFGANVKLFNGLLNKNAIKQNNLSLQASKMEEQQIKESVTLNVMLTYLQLLSNTDLLAQAKLQAELTRAHVKRLQTLDKGGAIPPFHLYDMEGQLATNELNITNTANSINTSKLALAQLMNVDFVPEISELINTSTVPQKYAFSVAEIQNSALNHLAAITGMTLRKESAERGLQVSKAQRYPTLTLGSNVYSNASSLVNNFELIGLRPVRTPDYIILNGNQISVIRPQPAFTSTKVPYSEQLGNHLGSSLSFNLRIPILNSGYSKMKIAESRVQLKRAELNEQTVINEVKQAVEMAYLNSEAAWELAFNVKLFLFRSLFSR